MLMAGTMHHANQARKRDCTTNTEDFQSLVAIVVTMAFILVYFLVKLDFSGRTGEATSETIILVPIFIVGTPLVLVLLYLVSNLVQAVIRKKPKKRRWGTEMAEYPDPEGKIKRRLDLQRKATHILMFVSMFIILAIVKPYASLYEDDAVFFGDRSGLSMLQTIRSDIPFSVTQGILILFFYVLSMVFLFIENTRIATWKYTHFPLHQTIQRTLRKKELDSIASYTHFSVGFLFASIFLMPTLLMGAFALFSIGDTMAATIGINFGKHKIGVNPEKSWEGTLGGFAFSFAAAVWFVGPVWALASALLFVAIDVFSPTPIKVADNILIPVSVAGLYWAFSLAGIPAVSLVL